MHLQEAATGGDPQEQEEKQVRFTQGMPSLKATSSPDSSFMKAEMLDSSYGQNLLVNINRMSCFAQELA